MNAKNELIRAIALEVSVFKNFNAEMSEETATYIFHQAFFRGHCPVCDGKACQVRAPRHVYCKSCQAQHSLTAHSPLKGTKIALWHWLAATWHLHVDGQSISAHAYHRRYGLRLMTAWKLLLEVRKAFPRIAPLGGSTSTTVLGKEAKSNEAAIEVATEDRALTILLGGEIPKQDGNHGARENRLLAGNLKAWLTSVFHGVSKEHVWLYLAEYADRFNRCYPGTWPGRSMTSF